MSVVRLKFSRRAARRLFPPVFSSDLRISSRSSCDTTDVKFSPSSGMVTDDITSVRVPAPPPVVDVDAILEEWDGHRD